MKLPLALVPPTDVRTIAIGRFSARSFLTPNRVIPAKTMEENRRILNRHREVLGLSKISFTHFVAWGIVRALEKHPSLNDAFGEVDGKPVRIRDLSVVQKDQRPARAVDLVVASGHSQMHSCHCRLLG